MENFGHNHCTDAEMSDVEDNAKKTHVEDAAEHSSELTEKEKPKQVINNQQQKCGQSSNVDQWNLLGDRIYKVKSAYSKQKFVQRLTRTDVKNIKLFLQYLHLNSEQLDLTESEKRQFLRYKQEVRLICRSRTPFKEQISLLGKGTLLQIIGSVMRDLQLA